RLPEDTGSTESLPLAPGMLASHYAPRTPVRLNAHRLEAGDALLAFGPGTIPGYQQASVMNLSEAGDLVEAAANLFSYLRELDAGGSRTIAVMT
ncbi:Sua5 family C-terminal domain-containing protein, partial [Acinetobacter baumannii]